jgi:CubicO group peptidase (beta-lactamase class C family)
MRNDAMKNKLIMMCSAAVAAVAANAADLPRATPESQGVDSKAIVAWLDACDKELQYMHGFVILRHGKVIAEGTWAPFDTLNKPHMLYSHSKSFTSTAIGFLVDDKKLDLDERVADIFSDKMPSNPPPWLLEARVRDLLTMNFGSDSGKQPKCNFDLADWERGILSRPMEKRPGTNYRYDSDATYLLACIVERRSGKRMMEFLKERLFDPVGMQSVHRLSVRHGMRRLGDEHDDARHREVRTVPPRRRRMGRASPYVRRLDTPRLLQAHADRRRPRLEGRLRLPVLALPPRILPR